MRHVSVLALLVGTLHTATAAADGFVEVSGGIMAPGCCGAWADFADISPKLAVRAGAMDRNWTDGVLSFDWTPIQTDAADTSAHRFRAIASYMVNGRVGALNLSARSGFGLDILRVRQSSESDTLVGWAFEFGAGLWFATGPVEIGCDLALPFGINGNATVGDLHLDSYLSLDVDLLVGVRHVWR